MSREVHVRFWERVGVRFPRATRLPLYRQSQIYARSGVELDRSTLAEWVGGSSELLAPLVEALRRHVMAAGKLHADDIPVPVLAPGLGKTKTGRLWTYVRDDRPAGDNTPAAVWFAYSPDRKGEHPQAHLKKFIGTLQADGYAGFDQVYETGRIEEAAGLGSLRHAGGGGGDQRSLSQRIAAVDEFVSAVGEAAAQAAGGEQDAAGVQPAIDAAGPAQAVPGSGSGESGGAGEIAPAVGSAGAQPDDRRQAGTHCALGQPPAESTRRREHPGGRGGEHQRRWKRRNNNKRVTFSNVSTTPRGLHSQMA